VVVVEHQVPDLAEEKRVSGMRSKALHQEIVGIVVVVGGGQARDRVEGILVVGFEVYLMGTVGLGMAETVETDLGGRTGHADGTLLGDLGQSTFCSIPRWQPINIHWNPWH